MSVLSRLEDELDMLKAYLAIDGGELIDERG